MAQNIIINGVQEAQELWTIYWQSMQQPATTGGILGGWQGPVISSYYAPALWPAGVSIDRRVLRGTANGVALPQAGEPWAMGNAITVVGVQCQLLSDNPSARLSLIIGQACGAGPDVFFHMAGIGCVEKTLWLPYDSRIQIDTAANIPAAHFDVYTACSDPYNVLASIFYLAPPVLAGQTPSAQ